MSQIATIDIYIKVGGPIPAVPTDRVSVGYVPGRTAIGGSGNGAVLVIKQVAQRGPSDCPSSPDVINLMPWYNYQG